MQRDLIEILACPQCLGDLTLRDAREANGEIESGTLACGGCGRSYPVVSSIPRFVPPENYATNFGFQWNHFRKTQLDSHSGVPISRDRWFGETGWSGEELRGKRVLDAGCGAGRFSEVALSTGARVVSLDYSSAVDACRANLAPNPALDVVQGDLFHLPFKPGSFDFVYCLGVVQHTPEVKRAVLSLPPQLQEGGRLTVDVYPKLWLNALWPKYWLRPITRRMQPERLFALIERSAPLLLAVSRIVGRIPLIGRRIRWAIPVANYEPDYPQLSPRQIREWAVLDTFDMFGPAYDQPQTAETMRAWLLEGGLEDVEAFRRGQVVARGRR